MNKAMTTGGMKSLSGGAYGAGRLKPVVNCVVPDWYIELLNYGYSLNDRGERIVLAEYHRRSFTRYVSFQITL